MTEASPQRKCKVSFGKQDCWDTDLIAPVGPDNLGTLTAIMTRNLGQQCRREVQGLIEDLLKECTKLEDASEQECLQDLFGWFVGAYLSDSFASKLALAPQEAMLWAGFHDGDPRGLNQTALEAFADMVDRSIVHPSTILGKVVRNNNDLLGCRGDPGASTPCFKAWRIDKGPVVNFWTSASLAFVQGMAAKNQPSVVAVLSKGLDPTEAWSLYDSVFWKYELATLAVEVSSSTMKFGFDFRPQLLLVDMRGTCEQMVAMVKLHLKMAKWDPHEVLHLLDEKPIICFDCAEGQCDLDDALAARVRSCLGQDWLSSVRNWFRPPKCPTPSS